MSFPKVFIIILNWNGLQDTLECLESVFKLTYENFEVAVVDNGSQDDSVSVIQNNFPNIRLILNTENLGYAGGNNVGIRYALGQNAEYIWLLNNDTVVETDALTNMVAEAEKDPSVGIAGSKIYYYNCPKKIWFTYTKIDWSRGISNHIGIGDTDIGQYDHVKDVDRVTGCSMLVKKDVCDKVGLFDERFFLYAEEVEWCVRARKAGFKCIFTPLSIVYHKVGASIKKNWFTIFSYYNTRNMLQTVRKNFSFPWREIYILNIVILKVWSLRKEIMKALIVCFTRTQKYSYNLSAILGILDFLRGRMGEVSLEKLLKFQTK